MKASDPGSCSSLMTFKNGRGVCMHMQGFIERGVALESPLPNLSPPPPPPPPLEFGENLFNNSNMRVEFCLNMN